MHTHTHTRTQEKKQPNAQFKSRHIINELICGLCEFKNNFPV